MVDHAARIAEWAVCNLRARAVLAGLLLGWVAWALSRSGAQAGHDGLVSFGIAAVVVVAGSASFVLHALHAETTNSRPTRAELLTKARPLVCLLGCGIVLAINGLRALFG